MRVIASLDELPALVGQEVAQSDWTEVTQAQIDLFADATGDHQWIHVDPMRAREGPYGGTIAHGFLTLSLLPKMFALAMRIEKMRMGVNYGLNKVRFPAPVPVGSHLRASFRLLSCEPVDGDGMQIAWGVNVERQGEAKPVCIAEFLQRRYR